MKKIIILLFALLLIIPTVIPKEKEYCGILSSNNEDCYCPKHMEKVSRLELPDECGTGQICIYEIRYKCTIPQEELSYWTRLRNFCREHYFKPMKCKRMVYYLSR